MLSLLFAAVLAGGGAVESAPTHDYTLAYHRSISDKRPLMVVVGAEWCPACEQLKNTTLRSMRRNGELEDVNVALVDRDANPELATKLMGGEQMIPQVIVFAQDGSGQWRSRKLTGFQPAQPIRSLIRRVLPIGNRR